MNETISTPTLLDWNSINKAMNTFVAASSGYTHAKRGFVTLDNGRVVFVKIGTDETTKKWVNKEIDAYLYLLSKGYEQLPLLLSIKEDNTAFALEYLKESDGWEWNTAWTVSRLNKTFEAMDLLATIEPNEIPKSFTQIRMVKKIENSWQIFIDNPSARTKLKTKLNNINRHDIIQKILNDGFLAQNFNFNFPQNVFTHYDIRNDNCAWNSKTQQVKLIDWNWVQLGNRDIDINSLLVSTIRSGFAIPSNISIRLNKSAFLWLAGSWFEACIGSLEGNISEVSALRDYQLQSALVAFELATNS